MVTATVFVAGFYGPVLCRAEILSHQDGYLVYRNLGTNCVGRVAMGSFAISEIGEE